MYITKRGYTQTGSKAHLPAFLQFLSNFNETLSKSFFSRGCAHFALHSAHFAPVSQLFLFLMLESCHLVCRCKFGLQLSSLKKKLGNWCKVRTVQCKMCSVRSLIAKKYSIRMFMKSKFMPAHQITAL